LPYGSRVDVREKKRGSVEEEMVPQDLQTLLVGRRERVIRPTFGEKKKKKKRKNSSALELEILAL